MYESEGKRVSGKPIEISTSEEMFPVSTLLGDITDALAMTIASYVDANV